MAWPPGRAPSRRTVARYALGGGAVLAAATIVLALVAPNRPAPHPTLDAAGFTARITDQHGDSAQIAAAAPGRPLTTLTAHRTASEAHNGEPADVYTATAPGRFSTAGLPTTVSVADVAEANGGRLPLGAHVTTATVPLRYTDVDTATFWVEPRTGRVVDVRWHDVVTRTATLSIGPLPLGTVHDQVDPLPAPAAADAVRAARHGVTTLDRHRTLTTLAVATGIVGGILLVTAALYAGLAWRQRRPVADAPTPTPEYASG